MWPAIAAMAAIGALQGAQQRKAQQQANQQSANITAAQTEFSPWTKISPQGFQATPITGNAFGGALQGGLSGAMFAQANKSQAPSGGDPNAPTGTDAQLTPEQLLERQRARGF